MAGTSALLSPTARLLAMPGIACVRAALLAAALTVVGVAAPPVSGADGGLTLTLSAPAAIDGSTRFDLSLVVANHGSTDCQVSTALTAAAVARVTRDGHAISPTLAGPGIFHNPPPSPAAQLVTVRAGGSVSVPVPHDAATLETLSTVGDGTGVIERWSIAAPGRYEITAALAPGAVVGCRTPGPVTAVVEAASRAPSPPILVIGAAAALVVLAALGGLLLARRRRRSAQAVITVLAILAGLVAVPRNAAAVVDDQRDGNPPEAAQQCLGLFAQPGGDPAGIYAAAQATSKVITITESKAYLMTEQRPKGTPASVPGGDVAIFWSPSVPDPGDVAADGCATLYYLLATALDMALGTVSYRPCPDGLSLEALRGYAAENLYRAATHLPERRTVLGRPLMSPADCTTPAKPKRPQRMKLTCGDRPCGSLGGDPHYRSYDGVHYDLQSVGEFVLTRSVDGTFEIQARQEVVPGWRSVSTVTAIAARIGSSRVVVRLASDASLVSGTGLVVTVDGVSIESGDAHAVGGGSVQLTDAGDQAAMRWPDGSVGLATIIPGTGIDVEVKPADALRGHLAGLLGDDDGNQANDLRLADGSSLAQPASFTDLHGPFADAWRITDATSLFAYDPGTSTATFTDRSFPGSADATPMSDQVDSARSICQDLGADPSDEADLADCAYDLAATGQGAFAMSAVDRSLPPADDAVELGDADAGATPTPTPAAAGVVDRGAMAAGDTVASTFGGPNERDVYHLHVDAGTVGFFTSAGDCSSLSGHGTPTWHLAAAAAPDQPVTTTLPFCVDLGRYTFGAAGDYLLVADAAGYTVPYSFTWRAVAVGSAAPVVVGTDVSGTISTLGQRDVYVLSTTSDIDISLVSPNACDDGFVAKVTQGESTPGTVALCGTSQPIHLGGGGEWQITVSAPDTTGSYTFRVQVH